MIRDYVSTIQRSETKDNIMTSPRGHNAKAPFPNFPHR